MSNYYCNTGDGAAALQPTDEGKGEIGLPFKIGSQDYPLIILTTYAARAYAMEILALCDKKESES